MRTPEWLLARGDAPMTRTLNSLRHLSLKAMEQDVLVGTNASACSPRSRVVSTPGTSAAAASQTDLSDYSILSATGADIHDSHRPRGAIAVWSICVRPSSSSRSVRHCDSDILGRSSSPHFPGKSGVGYHWMKRMGLVISLVLRRWADNPGLAEGQGR